MRAIMANEAASSISTRSPMVRITGFDTTNKSVPPSKNPHKERTQLPARQPGQLTTPPASASSSWRGPPVPSASPTPRSNEAIVGLGGSPSLFEASARQQMSSTPALLQSAGPSPSSAPKSTPQQVGAMKSTRPPSATVLTPAPAFPGLGPTIAPKRTNGGADNSRRRNFS
jgi:hypothetical protein